MSHQSTVWKYFTVNAIDDSHAICNICTVSVSCSTTIRSLNTMNLRAHLLRKHLSAHEQLLAVKKDKKTLSSTVSQPVSSHKQQTRRLFNAEMCGPQTTRMQ